MAPWIIFDALLAAMLVLIVPIGFWRGGVKEAILGGSILAGATLGNAFAVRWGPGVAELLGRRDAVGSTVVAEALLWGSVIILGYLGGATIRRAGQSLVGRLAGGIIGLFNGLLLLGFTLRFINILLLGQEPDRWTEGGFIAAVLSRGTEELLLLTAVVISIGIIAGLLAHLFGTSDLENDLLAAETAHGAGSRAWPATPPTPRLAYERHDSEGVKIEPDPPAPNPRSLREFAPAATWLGRHEPEDQRGATALGETSVRTPFDVQGGPSPRRPTEEADIDAHPADGASVVNEWLRRGPHPERNRDERA